MLRNPTLDGVCVHEFANVMYLNLWPDIADVVNEWMRETGQAAPIQAG
jgi:hypothetical protein